jgi:hypothetical protein
MYEKVTISSFMKAWFEKDYSELSHDDFQIVYGEYVDTSGLFLSDDFERQAYIYYLSERLNYVKMFLRLQRDFIVTFGKPFQRDFERFYDQHGYRLKWNDDLEDFEKQLVNVEMGQQKFETILDARIKELNQLRGKDIDERYKDSPEDELKKSRISFIRMLNSLVKIGYKVDKPVTTVEELALMIKQQLEEVESMKSYGR